MKIQGIEIEDVTFLKDQVVYNFGSIKRFSIVSGYNYRKILKNLNDLDLDKKEFGRIKELYYIHVDKNKIPFRINNEDRAKIRLCILTSFNSYTDFCKKHEEFDVVYITNVVKGNLKLRSTKYFALIKLLKKKYKLKVD